MLVARYLSYGMNMTVFSWFERSRKKPPVVIAPPDLSTTPSRLDLLESGPVLPKLHVKVSRVHKSLIVPEHEGVRNLFPDAICYRDGNTDCLVVPHGIRETLMLRHLGFQVPNPMEYYYDWCGGKPYAVQVATCCMLTENSRGYVLNGMGTGKTKTALWAWDFLNREGVAGKLLVVAPLSTLKFVWAREVFGTLPRRKVQVLHGTEKQRLENLAADADIYVINHDGIKVIYDELLARGDIDTLVLDELAVYRNNSQRSKDMRKFAPRFSIVWGMTGSPMPNEPTDVWAQCKVVTPHTVPRYRNNAREMLMIQVAPYVWVPKKDAVEQAFRWMKPACRYALDEVVELPPLVSRTIDVSLSAEQDDLYKKILKTLAAEVKNKKITAANAGVAVNKLLQVAGGWVYTTNPEFVRVDPSPRIMALADCIFSAERKVLVAVPYTHMLAGISNLLTKSKIEHCVVHGGTQHREHTFNAFQNTTKYKVMLVHPVCVHHGITLTAADTTIWYLPSTSFEVYEQFNARFRRIGQQFKQQLLHLQATPTEKKLYRMLVDKDEVQGTFLQLVEEATGDIS